jgi:ACS family sodium-dependent inorganic phosphate cotransporter
VPGCLLGTSADYDPPGGGGGGGAAAAATDRLMSLGLQQPLLLAPAAGRRGRGGDLLPAAAPEPELPLLPGGCRRRRSLLTVFGFGACFVMEIARSFSVVVIPMSKEMHWDDKIKGAILASSFYGYAPMQVPSGMIAHHFNRPTRQIFACMALLCVLNASIPAVVRGAAKAGEADFGSESASGEGSTPPANMAAAYALTALMVPIGIAQSLMNPSLHKLISSWAPLNERTQLHNSIYSGQNAGKMLATASSALIAATFGWPVVFWTNAILCGCFGVVWLCVVSDDPSRDPHISRAEHDHIRASIASDSDPNKLTANAGGESTDGAVDHHSSLKDLPCAQILTSLPFWAIVINHFVADWAGATTSSWVPSWLKEDLGYDLKHAGFLATLPSLAAFVVVVISGPIALAMLERGTVSVTTLRKCCQGGGLLLPAALLLLLCYADGRAVVITLMVAATAFNSLTYSGHHVNHIDLSPRFAPILYGITNTVANTAPIISNWVNGAILGDDQHSTSAWHHVFLLSAAIQVCGAAFWLALASGRRQVWG